MPHRKRSGQVPFSLVQLLVVIGLMGLILCYVVLVSNRVDRSSIRVRCAINLKQIGNALILYANENKGSFPRSHYVDGAALQTTNDGFADVNVGVALPASAGKINNIPQAMFLLIRQEELTPAVFVCPDAMKAVADTMGGMPASSRSNFTGDGSRAAVGRAKKRRDGSRGCVSPRVCARSKSPPNGNVVETDKTWVNRDLSWVIGMVP